MLPILITLAASTSFARGAGVLQRRAGQTSATCTSDFAWMDNSHNASPCQVVSQLDAICNNGNWLIADINSTQHYDNPDPAAGTATFCTCSWASYNLISACTVCQNADFQSKIAVWTDYSSLCSGRLSDTYFPSNITLSEDLTIPFWAGQDPTTWTNGKFDVGSAQQIARENHADLGQAPTPHKKSNNVGAIVGGVIGGLVVIAAAVAAALYILRRQRKLSHAPGTLPLSDASGHMRSMSDVTTTSTRAYTTQSSTPFKTPGSPTIMTHNTSVRSVPFFSSVAASTVPYGTASPPPRQQVASPPPGNREDVIEPFTTPPQQANISHDRKQSNGSGFPVYDSPSAPPPGGMRMEISRPITPSQSQRAGRYNPPAYSESSVGHSSRPAHRGKQESSDTLHSLTSSRNHGTRPTLEHSPSSSGSGMANIVGQMSTSNNEPGSSGSTPGPGRQVSNASRDEKRRPAEDESISGRDIA